MNYDNPATVPAVWQIGDVILEKYEVKEVFTGGGMGLVYRVHHRDWNMDLAVKSPRPEFFQTKQHVENFEREAETWVNLGLHPHTVSCFYVRRLGGIPRIFSEFIEGGTLADWIRTKKLYEAGEEKALKRIIDVSIQFAWGLQYAHEKDLIHQDVKPGNVLMSPDGIVNVSDFGLANARRASGEITTIASQTAQTGQSILIPGSGLMTPEYASPEQIRGEHLSRKTDIWSWGVSLLEMLLGELTWTSGLAAPVILEDAKYHVEEELVALLEGCFGLHGRERFISFEPVIKELIDYYNLRFGIYPREKPITVQNSSDVMNNRAISFTDLGNNQDALTALESALSSDPTHALAIYNYALLNRRLNYKSDEFGRDSLNTLLHYEPIDEIALIVNGLFCIERGLAFRAFDLLMRHRSLSNRKMPYSRDLEAMIQNTPDLDITPPKLFKVTNGAVNWLKVSLDGTRFIVSGVDGISSYLTVTGELCSEIGKEYRFLKFAGGIALLFKERRVYTWNLNDEPCVLEPFRIEIPTGEHFAVTDSGLRCCTIDYNIMRMIDTSNGEILWEDELDYDTERGDPHFNDLVFSNDERFVLFARDAYTENLQVRDVEDGSVIEMGNCAVDSCKLLIPFGNRFILSISWNYIQLWDLESHTAVGSRKYGKSHASISWSELRLGVPSANTEMIAIMETDGIIEFLKTPHLSPLVTIAWHELFCGSNQPQGHAICLASSDSRTWLIGTSAGEVVSFRLSEPRSAPLLISKPISTEHLTIRWEKQAKLLECAKLDFKTGDYLSALKYSREALLIHGSYNIEASELYDRVVSFGRKQKVKEAWLVFDLDRTEHGWEFKFINVSRDGRCALLKRTNYYETKDYVYTGDHNRLIYLPNGKDISLGQLPFDRYEKYVISRNNDSIIVAMPSKLEIYKIAEDQVQELTPPMPIEKIDGGVSIPLTYYCTSVQYALDEEIVVASDLNSDWYSNSGNWEEYHFFSLKNGAVNRIQTDTPKWLRRRLCIMSDGFHAYRCDGQKIYWLEYPFNKDLKAFQLPAVNSINYKSRRRSDKHIEGKKIVFSSDGAFLFYGDWNGDIHVLKTEIAAEWRTFTAHQGEILGIFTASDPRFISSVAVDGFKIWNANDMSLLYYNQNIAPSWLSHDFRFAAEKSGKVWEIEWEYSFERPDNLTRLIHPYIKTFLQKRRASAELQGCHFDPHSVDYKALALELAFFGCGSMSQEDVTSILSSDYHNV